MLQSGHCTTGIFNDKGIHNVDFDLAEGKGNVDEDCNEDFIGDPGQARKPFARTNNLRGIRAYVMNCLRRKFF